MAWANALLATAPQDVANMIYATAILDFRDEKLLAVATAKAGTLLHAFKAQELSATAYALGRLPWRLGFCSLVSVEC